LYSWLFHAGGYCCFVAADEGGDEAEPKHFLEIHLRYLIISIWELIYFDLYDYLNNGLFKSKSIF